MARSRPEGGRLPKGVAELTRPRDGRPFRAAIRHKGIEAHLGLYETRWIAAFAYNAAAAAIGRGATPPNEIPLGEMPSSDRVREITGRVRRRLGLDRPGRASSGDPPSPESLLTFFEITVVGFWRAQATENPGDSPERALETAAARVVEAARLLFWDHHAGMPSPEDAASDLLARRLDAEFRRSDLTREVLDDDGDDPIRVAKWLAWPDDPPWGRGFGGQVRHLYPEHFPGEEAETSAPPWAEVLGVTPPFAAVEVRDAYRQRSKTAHPDAGGTAQEFVRLNRAYEAARTYFRLRGVQF